MDIELFQTTRSNCMGLVDAIVNDRPETVRLYLELNEFEEIDLENVAMRMQNGIVIYVVTTECSYEHAGIFWEGIPEEEDFWVIERPHCGEEVVVDRFSRIRLDPAYNEPDCEFRYFVKEVHSDR
ncbi:hypothetical protein JW978_00360 [Candidatus Dojkabacteria bacterium]|nr:hypothetical protein [Candidatus Dojkabacteria bacterium]